jgi:hypothetical protein
MTVPHAATLDDVVDLLERIRAELWQIRCTVEISNTYGFDVDDLMARGPIPVQIIADESEPTPPAKRRRPPKAKG